MRLWAFIHGGNLVDDLTKNVDSRSLKPSCSRQGIRVVVAVLGVFAMNESGLGLDLKGGLIMSSDTQ